MILSNRNPWFVIAGAALIFFLITFASYARPRQSVAALTTSESEKGSDINTYLGSEYSFKSPNYEVEYKSNKKVVGLLFVGRKRYVEILECYVSRNLVRNGGHLDEVRWIINSKTQEDLDYLETIVHQVPEYTTHSVTSYEQAYEFLDRDVIYVKIDDDIVFFEDNAISSIVKRLDENPQYLAVSANVMNQPALAFVHYHLGAIHPYLPEQEKPENFVENASVQDWRVSNIPQWPEDLEVIGEIDEELEVPFEGHRWRRLVRESDLVQTPAGILGHGGEQYSSFSKAWSSWAIAAQEHYSFFENLEKQELWRYKFDLWNYFYERISINFIAFRGEDLIDYPVPDWDDEGYLTQKLPSRLQRPAVLDGHGLAVHFGFNPQTQNLNSTDLLGRYKNYADEFICGRTMKSSR